MRGVSRVLGVDNGGILLDVRVSGRASVSFARVKWLLLYMRHRQWASGKQHRAVRVIFRRFRG